MEVLRAQMLGNPAASATVTPRIRLNQHSDSECSMSIDSATMHELISKCHSMGDVSTGSDSVFISDGPPSRRLSWTNLTGNKNNNNESSDEHSPFLQPEHVPPSYDRSDLGVASIFAQSVLSGYLQSHRESITAAIEAIGGPTESTDDDESDTTETYDSERSQDDSDLDDQDRPSAVQVQPEVPRTLNFSTVLSPIEENGETPTSETPTQPNLEKIPSSCKHSMTDLISASSMEDLKEFLMLETLYDATS